MSTLNRKLVVMGGSFNPPTIAHFLLMKNAIDELDAELGYFVPVSDAYLRRKMRHIHPPIVLPEDMRMEMLEAMCEDDSRMRVSDKELGYIEARTLPTLKLFKEELPEYELYFIMGDDKLDLLSHLVEKASFFDTAKVILYSRNSKMTESSLKKHEILSNYTHNIVMLSQPEGINGISSSLIRNRLLAGESCKELLVPGVWEIFKSIKAENYPDVIYSFKDEYDFLSNRFGCSFIWQGIRYDNVETAFQSSKYEDEAERKLCSRQSAEKAAMKGGQIIPSPEWKERKLETMMSIQVAKFSQNPSLKKRLIATGECKLINGNHKKETYWGVDLYSWKGENNLGKILMSIRDKEKKKMRYNVEIIKEMVRKNLTTEIIYFWGHTPNPKKITKSCFSQWYDVYFEVDGIQYHTTEQYMMASKARLFGDEDTLKAIMNATNPSDYKKLGRKVKGFEPTLWDEKKLDIVVEGNKAKFGQNPELREYLLSTNDAILVEASPYDTIWGIGMDRDTALNSRIEDWKGENLLGCALMEVRDYLRNMK